MTCFEKIYNNWLTNIYLSIFITVKDELKTLNIINQALKRVLIYEYEIYGFHKISERLKNSIITKKITFADDFSNEELNVPKIIYKLHFNVCNVFNQLDNIIFSQILIYNISSKFLSIQLNTSEEYINYRLKEILKYIRNVYLCSVKEELENAVGNNVL